MALLRNMMNESEMIERERPREEDIRGSYYRDTTAIIILLPLGVLNIRHRCFMHHPMIISAHVWSMYYMLHP